MPYLVGVTYPINNPASGSAFLPLPPHRAGDIVCVVIGTDEGASSSGVSIAGFTEGIVHNGAAFVTRIVWWRRALADNEAAPSITHTFTTDSQWHALVIRGCVASGSPIDVSATDDNETTGTHIAPAVTTTVDDCGILILDCNFSAPGYTSWTNATISPREIADPLAVARNANQTVGMAWGHMATAGSTGTISIVLTASVTSGCSTIAFKPGPIDLVSASTFRDSILSSEPASASAITLPTHAADDLLVAVIAGSSQAITFAATLSGFTRLFDQPGLPRGNPFSVFTKRATSASETNPTITHTFTTHDWAVVIFSITGECAGWLWESNPDGTTHAGELNLEAAAPAKIVGLDFLNNDFTTTSVTYDVATGETEQEDGGPSACKIGLYTADLAAAGWVGTPTWVVSGTTDPAWLTLAFSEETPPTDDGDDGENGGGGAVRRPPRISNR